ncbi:MAG: hypothetical protein ACOC8K_03745 [Gemmatimonadota bacterium]
MTPPREILEGAYGRSTKNQPGEIATEETELLDIVTQALRGLFIFGTRLNPTFFGAEDTVSVSSGSWPLPSDLEHLFRVEDDGDKVEVVPFDDRAVAHPKPAVYHLGGRLYPAGNANDPTDGDLDLFYAKQADAPADLDSELDAFWPEAYDSLLELEVAIYLAIKDGRTEEVPLLQNDRDVWAIRFAAHVEHYAPTTMDRFGGQVGLQVESVVPLGDLLAGGSEAF